MFAHLVSHRSKPGQEQPLLDSMGRACDALRDCPGLLRVTRLRERASGALIGLALWDSEAAWQAGIVALRAAVNDLRSMSGSPNRWRSSCWTRFEINASCPMRG
jgi:heme-degrading monooxygenase HmoA